MRSCVPAKTLTHILRRACDELDKTQKRHLETQSKRFPEAKLSFVSIFSDATSSELPLHKNWKGAYNTDPTTKAILDVLDNPSKVDSLDVIKKLTASIELL